MSLCKILIVEDESILRQGISAFREWSEHGFAVVGGAQNGQEALRLISQCEPDIVITDIMMPVMNGVELIRRIKAQYPEVRVIVLSNYDDFAHVKEAMREGASDYLLKSEATVEHLLEVCHRLRQREKPRGASILDASQQARVEREALLRQVLLGTQMGEEQLAGLGLGQADGALAVAIVDFKHREGELAEDLAGPAAATLGQLPRAAAVAEGRARCLCLFPYAPEEMRRLYEQANQMALTEGCCVNMVVGTRVSGAGQAVLSYQSALTYAPFAFYLNGSGVMDLNRETYAEGPVQVDDKQLVTWIDELRFQEIGQAVQEMLHRAQGRAHYADPYELLKAGEGILYYMLLKLERLACDTVGLRQFKLRCFKALESCAYVRDFEQTLRNGIAQIGEMILRQSTGTDNPVIQSVIQFMVQNCHQEINLRATAEKFSINYSYLSQLFKSQTGSNFSDYLQRLRIEKACALLRKKQHNVSEICGMCGFNDLSYFSKVFRKHMGVLPTDYLQQP